MKLAIFGQGYVGLTLAVGAANSGTKVVGFDVNKELITDLLRSETNIPGIERNNLQILIASQMYCPTFDFEVVQGSDVLVIAVPTPLDSNRIPDLSALRIVSELIATKFRSDALVINESTSYPGTLRNFIKPIVDQSKLATFLYASAPERIDPGNRNWTLQNTPRVISGITEEATDKAVQFYAKFCNAIYRAPSPEVAEASKIFENTFRQINIALANEFSTISSHLGFSAFEAIKAAATKPFGFMPFYPSIGVGGHCIPVDPSYLSYISEKIGIEAKFINLANKTNLDMARSISLRLKALLGGSLTGKKIQIAGIAYKPEVADMRESPSLLLIKELRILGANVIWYDPLVKQFNGELSTDLSSNIDLGLLVSPHESMDLSIWKSSGTHVLDLSANSKNYGWNKFL